MSFYDDASLVFLPSGGAGKDTKAYSIKPTDGSGDFTFSRGNNLSATRVDSNGLIEKGRENLLKQSNQFDTTWSKNPSNVSITSGFSGYDGSNNAWKLEAVSDNNFSVISQTISNAGVETFSVYAKAGTSNFIRIHITGGTNTSASYFDLSGSGSVGTNFNNIDAKIESVGNGWFRCSVTGNKTTSTTCVIYVVDANGSSNVTTGANIYIQDAQLELGLVATEYIESGASTGKAGILEHSPRFDYSGGASCPSLLLEPSRTNLVEYSEYLGSWFSSGGTLTPNAAISPEGVQNAYSYTNSAFTTLRDSVTLSTSTQYTFSFYAKNVDATNARYRVYDDTNATDVISATSYFSQLSTNEWKRIEVTFTTSATGTAYGVYLASGNQSGKVLFYGAQVEEGSYPTSYIPNHSGGSETRDADVTSVTSVSDLIGQTEGTIYCEFEYNGAADSGVFNRIIALGTGVTQNRILLAKNDTTAELVAFAVTGGTTQVFQAIATTSIIGRHKVAMSYKANEYKVYLDGQLKFTDTSASVPATTDVYVGTAEDGTTDNELGGVVKQSIIFKEVLSEDNCKALTTL